MGNPSKSSATLRYTVRVRDIEKFADRELGIKLFPAQLQIIDAIANGKTLFLGRRAGYNTARRVLKAFVEQDNGYIKHFDKTHFVGLTIDDRPFLYCPVGNIVSWSESDVENRWCEYCKESFDQIKVRVSK